MSKDNERSMIEDSVKVAYHVGRKIEAAIVDIQINEKREHIFIRDFVQVVVEGWRQLNDSNRRQHNDDITAYASQVFIDKYGYDLENRCLTEEGGITAT